MVPLCDALLVVPTIILKAVSELNTKIPTPPFYNQAVRLTFNFPPAIGPSNGHLLVCSCGSFKPTNSSGLSLTQFLDFAYDFGPGAEIQSFKLMYDHL